MATTRTRTRTTTRTTTTTTTTRATTHIPVVEQRYHDGLKTDLLYIVSEEVQRNNNHGEEHRLLFLPATEHLLSRLCLMGGGATVDPSDNNDNDDDNDDDEEEQDEEQEGEEAKDLLETTSGSASSQRLGVFLEGQQQQEPKDGGGGTMPEEEDFHSCVSVEQRSSSNNNSLRSRSCSRTVSSFLEDEKQQDQQEQPILHPCANDIVLGRRFRQSVGSQYLWELVVERSPRYAAVAAATETEGETNWKTRRAIHDEILQLLAHMQPPARFLKRSPKLREWEIAQHRRIHDKIEGLFREAMELLSKEEGGSISNTKTTTTTAPLLVSKGQLKNEELLNWLDTATTVGSSVILHHVTETTQLSILCDLVNQTILASRDVRLDHGRPIEGHHPPDSYHVIMVPLSSPSLFAKNEATPNPDTVAHIPTPVVQNSKEISNEFGTYSSEEGDDPPDMIRPTTPGKSSSSVDASSESTNVISTDMPGKSSTDRKSMGPSDSVMDTSPGLVGGQDVDPNNHAAGSLQQTIPTTDSSQVFALNGYSGDSGKETLRRIALTPAHLRCLRRVTGLKELMRDALKAIKQFKEYSSSEQTKEKTRKHRDQVEQPPTVEGSIHHKDGENTVVENEQHHKDGDEKDEKDLEDEKDEKDPEATLYDSSWLRLIRSMNSLAVVVPTLLNIVLHEHSDNEFIQLGKNNLQQRQALKRKKSKSKAPCWLLGTKVYDICARSDRLDVIEQLYDICKYLGLVTKATERELTKIDWRAYLDPLMRHLCDMSCVIRSKQQSNGKLPDPIVTLRIMQHPLSKFVGLRTENPKTLEDMDISCRRLDVHFGFSSTKQSEPEKQKHKEFQRAVDDLHERVSQILCKRFTHSDTSLTVYGSCLSSLSPSGNMDVDMSLHLDQAKYLKKTLKQECKAITQKISDVLGKHDDFTDIVPLVQTRVPVLKGKWKDAKNPYSSDGSLDFDICLWNEIAVANSLLIREYCSIDERVSEMCMAVKQWAKNHKISSAADKTLSTYTWMNLVLFYLIRIGFVPNLQSRDLFERSGLLVEEKANPLHKIKDFDTFFMKWEQVRGVWKRPDVLENVSVTALLFGFFDFYANDALPESFILGIRMPDKIVPKTAFRRCTWFWAVEDPFETYDSHTPHNLGAHADELGAKRIRRFVREAYLHLHAILESVIADESIHLPTNNLLPRIESSSEPENIKSQGLTKTTTSDNSSKTNVNDSKPHADNTSRSSSKRSKKDDSASRSSSTRKSSKDVSSSRTSSRKSSKDDSSSRTSSRKSMKDDTSSRTRSRKSLKDDTSSRTSSRKSLKDDTSSRTGSKRSSSSKKTSQNEEEGHSRTTEPKSDSSVPTHVVTTKGKSSSSRKDRNVKFSEQSDTDREQQIRRSAFYGGLAHGLLVGIVGTIVVFELMSSSKGGRRRR